jgi:hypothetical protein
MLASPALLAPNAGSETVFDHPTTSHSISAVFSSGLIGKGERVLVKGEAEGGNAPRARNRSSDSIAMAFTNRTETKPPVSNFFNLPAVCSLLKLSWL